MGQCVPAETLPRLLPMRRTSSIFQRPSSCPKLPQKVQRVKAHANTIRIYGWLESPISSKTQRSNKLSRKSTVAQCIPITITGQWWARHGCFGDPAEFSGSRPFHLSDWRRRTFERMRDRLERVKWGNSYIWHRARRCWRLF